MLKFNFEKLCMEVIILAKEKNSRLIAQNKKAYHDYFIEETFQAGLSLAGTEVKSLRMGKCSLKESFIRIENGEARILCVCGVFFFTRLK